MTELSLTEACKKRDPFAQRSLYNLYAKQMYLICIRYVVQQHDAEEILSDAFLKCFLKIGQFRYRGEGSLKAWLTRIVVNECLAFMRKKKRLIISLEQYEHQAAGSDPPLGNLQTKEIMQQIMNLPDGYRTVLNLYIFESKTHKEIAALLDISENTSKSQLHKARAMLKTRLADQK